MGEPMVCAQTGQGGVIASPQTARNDEAVVLGCLACGHVLGYTSACQLSVNGVVLTQATVLTCSACGKRRHWKPLEV